MSEQEKKRQRIYDLLWEFFYSFYRALVTLYEEF